MTDDVNKPWVPEIREVFSHSAGRLPRQLVSICVTNFNYARFLPACLDSLAAQTHRPLELVIVDDCSTGDDSVAVATAWLEANAKRFWRASLLRHVRNQGPSEARNTAFRRAASDYVFVIDADNTLYPRAMSRLYAAINDGAFDATYSQIERFGDDRGIGSADIWDPEQMARENYVDVMALIRKSCWERVGGFSHIEEGWEDYDFWLKFIDAGLLPGYVPEVLCRYRVHGKSRTAVEAHVFHYHLKQVMAYRHPTDQAAPVD